jgi:hypothetical protein
LEGVISQDAMNVALSGHDQARIERKAKEKAGKIEGEPF